LVQLLQSGALFIHQRLGYGYEHVISWMLVYLAAIHACLAQIKAEQI